ALALADRVATGPLLEGRAVTRLPAGHELAPDLPGWQCSAESTGRAVRPEPAAAQTSPADSGRGSKRAANRRQAKRLGPRREPRLFHQERRIRSDDPVLLAEPNHLVLHLGGLAVQPDLLEQKADLPARPELRDELELLLRRRQR